VFGTPPVHGLPIGVAPGTDGRGLNRLQLGRVNDVCRILLLDMFAGRTVTGLTPCHLHAGLGLKGRYPAVDSVFETAHQVLVAVGTGLGTHVLGPFNDGYLGILRLLFGLFHRGTGAKTHQEKTHYQNSQ